MKRASLSDTSDGLQQRDPVQPVRGVWMIPNFGNTGVVETKEGLVLVDMPLPALAKRTMEALRRISSAPVHTIFFTHGHADHAFGVGPLMEEAQTQMGQRPRIVAHRNVPKRFQRYRMLAGFHDHINRIQFGVADGVPAFPLPEWNPDVTFDRSISVHVGEIDFHAYHELGETDDHLWVWVPQKGTVFAGDMVIWSFPNVGNPFKVQRYTLEWAQGLEAIMSKQPEVIVPGHGPVIQGKDRIQQVLRKISTALRYLHDEVVMRLNQGKTYEEILHEVDLPEEMMDSEFLAPRYGCPKFVVHGIIRQYTGWYDGNPSNLFPPMRRDIISEIGSLVGKDLIISHARDLREQGRDSMALQFLDMALALDLDPEEQREMRLLKAQILSDLGDRERSFIAKNIYYRGHNDELEKVRALEGSE